MFAQMKNTGFVPFIGYGFFILFSLNVLIGYNGWPFHRRSASKALSIAEVLSPNTFDTLYEDAEFRNAVFAFVSAAADTTKKFAEHYDSDTFRKVGQDIDAHILKLRAVPVPPQKPRGLIDSLTGALTGGGAGASGTPATTGNGDPPAKGGDGGGGLLSSLGNLLGIGGGGGAGNDTGGLTGLLSQGISSLGNSLVGSLDQPAFFLGAGLSMGAASGLNLSTADAAKAAANKAAAANNYSDSGINGVAMNLGNGLSSSIVPLVPLSSFGGNIGPAAFALAQGIGNGTVSGLGLTNQVFTPSNGSNITDIAGSFGLGVSQPIASAINITQLFNAAASNGGMLTSQIPAALEGAGKGLGEGAAQGLNIVKPNNAVAPRQAPAAGKGQIDVPAAAEGFTRGLSVSFLQSADLNLLAKNVMGGMGMGNIQDMITQQLPQVISRTGKGLGEGAAQGLGIIQAGKAAEMQNPPPVTAGNGSFDIPGVAEGFTRSLSSSFLGSVDLSSITGALGGQGNQIMAQLPGIAAGAGKGLGEGAAQGLGLTTPSTTPSTPPPAGNLSLARRQAPAPGSASPDFSAIAESFTKSLTTSFLGDSNLSIITSALMPNGNPLGGANLMQMVVPGALGLSKGLGQGAAIGLGLQNDTGLPPPSNPDPNALDVGLVAQAFGKGLTQDFLANGTAANLAGALKSVAGSSASSINVPKAVEGFARGLVDGAMYAVSSVGGVSNIISGNISMDFLNKPPMDMGGTQFNDSVGGAASAFGRGFGNEGVLLVSAFISNKGVLPTSPKNMSMRKRGLYPSADLDERGLVLSPRAQVSSFDLVARQDNPDNTAVTPIINGSFAGMIAQGGINALQCKGIGGLVAVGLGLIESKTISLSMLGLDNRTKALLPSDPITINFAGNQFVVKAQDMKVTVNGLAIVPFAVFTALHIFLVSAAYFFVLPGVLILNAAQRISVLIGKPVNSVKSQRWQKRLFALFAIMANVGSVLGIVGMGNSKQFRNAHGIIGLLTFIFTIAATIIFFRRYQDPRPIGSEVFLPFKLLIKNRPKLTLPLANGIALAVLTQFSTLAFITGVDDLSTVSLCAIDGISTLAISVGFGTGIMFTFTSVMAVIMLRFWLEQRMIMRRVNGMGEIYISNPEEGAFPRESKLVAAGALPGDNQEEIEKKQAEIAERVKRLRDSLR